MQTELKKHAIQILRQFKGGDEYIFGLQCLDRLGKMVRSVGHRVTVVSSGFGRPWGKTLRTTIENTFCQNGIELAGPFIQSASPNTPKEDVFRIAEELREQSPDVVVAVGGGSCIDAVKAALVWVQAEEKVSSLDAFYGNRKVSQFLEKNGGKLIPLTAVQTASGSASHLTRYANVTDKDRGQKMLIIDDVLVPERALFDYAQTVNMSRQFTIDGALDGISHCLEVYYGIDSNHEKIVEHVVLTGIELIIQALPIACEEPENLAAREALGLGTDLGGYAIMLGGTNGAHLTSFSLVDLLPHGRACAILNPYYTVFFAPAIENRLRKIGEIYRRAGWLSTDIDSLRGRELGVAVADAMRALSQSLGFPVKLEDINGFNDHYIKRALAAAKDPKLESKLRNMPVPLTGDMIEKYMAPVLYAAKTGDFSLIRNV